MTDQSNPEGAEVAAAQTITTSGEPVTAQQGEGIARILFPDRATELADAVARVENAAPTNLIGQAMTDALLAGTGVVSMGFGEETQRVDMRMPLDLAERVGELTEDEIKSVLEEGAVVLGVDLAAGPDETETLFNVTRLDLAHRLPVVASEVESQTPYTAEGSITVFRGRDGQNMELVLVPQEFAFAGEVSEDTIVLTNHRGLVLVAQPFINPQD